MLTITTSMRTLMGASFLFMLATPLEASADERFSGLRHGRMKNTRSLQKELVVSNAESSGAGGVRISLGRVRAWSAERLQIVPTSLKWTASFSATGSRGGRRVQPSLGVREQFDQRRGRYLIGYTPSFGASNYRIEIFNGPTLVYRLSNLEAGSQAVLSSNDAICDALGKANSVALGVCEWVVAPDFRQNDANECEFTLSGQSRDFFFEDGAIVQGDRIRFVEQPEQRPAPATFRRMVIETAEVETLTLGRETTEVRP